MTKQKLNKLMKEYDKQKKPKHWKKFINKNSVSHNLILKYGKSSFCTHCQKYFYEEVSVHPYKKATCPHCNLEYYVRNHNIKNFTFAKDIALYSKVDDKVIIKIFEIESKYDAKIRKFKQTVQEYARFIPDVGLAINNSVSFYMWNTKIYHNTKILEWHIYTGNKVLSKMPIYPYNKRSIFKGTVYEYAPIKEFRQKFKYYDDFEILQLAGYRSFELLWKMGLHRLSLSAKHFNKTGCFEKRFGVPKSFLKFMIEHDLNYEQYSILKLLQETNIDLINHYRNYNYKYLVLMKEQGYLKDKTIVHKFHFDRNELQTICKYVPLRKLLNYTEGLFNLNIYKDYLNMLKKLGYSMKSKDELFPENLVEKHDELMKQIKIMADMDTQFGVYLRYLELSKYTYQDENYIIFPAPSVSDLTDEGEQQGNCVAREYIGPYKNKQTEIYFIRKLDDITKSFITLEYKNGHIAQRELPHHNRNFTQEHIDFMDKWLGHRQFTDIKEKYKTKVVRYDLEKLVA